MTFLGLLTIAPSPQSAQATPLIALREAENCQGCHRGGRGQKPFLWRRCTLDCQGCHVDPAGAGPRNEWGFYYTHDQLAMLNIHQPIDPLQDQSFFDAHYDGRIASVKSEGKEKFFPMSSEATLRLKPFQKVLSLSYSAYLLGRSNDDQFRVVNEGDRRFRERYALMLDALPLNTYIRAYRGQPMYGLRRPNHTLWIRERVGLGPYATTEAIEMGGTPNVPYWRYSQMTGDPYVEKSKRQAGHSFHGGFRGVTLGWHLNYSSWDTQSATHGVKMNAYGYGANVFGVILYGENNSRTVRILDPQETAEVSPSYLHPSSEISEYTIAFAWLTGVMFGLITETYQDAEHKSQRQNLFLDLHPLPWLQLELWNRKETGARTFTDNLLITHFYTDF